MNPSDRDARIAAAYAKADARGAYVREQARRVLADEVPVYHPDSRDPHALQALFYLRMAVRHLREAEKDLEDVPKRADGNFLQDVIGIVWQIDVADGLIASNVFGGFDTRFVIEEDDGPDDDNDDDPDDTNDDDDPDISFTPDLPLVAWMSQ